MILDDAPAAAAIWRHANIAEAFALVRDADAGVHRALGTRPVADP
jgi:hypothetical protein